MSNPPLAWSPATHCPNVYDGTWARARPQTKRRPENCVHPPFPPGQYWERLQLSFICVCLPSSSEQPSADEPATGFAAQHACGRLASPEPQAE